MEDTVQDAGYLSIPQEAIHLQMVPATYKKY